MPTNSAPAARRGHRAPGSKKVFRIAPHADEWTFSPNRSRFTDHLRAQV